MSCHRAGRLCSPRIQLHGYSKGSQDGRHCANGCCLVSCAKSARKIDHQANEQDQSHTAAAKGRTAPVETAAAEQEEKYEQDYD